MTHTMEQNMRQLPWTSVDGSSVLSDAYTYDANANVAGIADALTPSVSTRNMTHDSLDRLWTVAAPGIWGNVTYGYDAIDNLTSTSITGGATARTTTHTINAATRESRDQSDN
jgi:hypothetical protein